MLKYNSSLETARTLNSTRHTIRYSKVSEKRGSSDKALENNNGDQATLKRTALKEIDVKGSQRTTHHLESRSDIQVHTDELSKLKELLSSLRSTAKHNGIEQFTYSTYISDLENSLSSDFPRVDFQVNEPILVENQSTLVSTEHHHSLKSFTVLQESLTSDPTKSYSINEYQRSIVLQTSERGKVENDLNTEVKEHLADQRKRSQDRKTRIQKMIDIIENAQQKSALVIANLTNLRQLSVVQLQVQATEIQLGRVNIINIFTDLNYEL